MRSYAREYIEACRSRVEADLSAYRSLVKAVQALPTSEDLTSALGVFETRFFNDLVLLLDYFFVHRLAGTEGKDGNPLNEVRMLANSMLQNNSVFATCYAMTMPASQGDKSIKLLRLSSAFFAEIDRRFAAATDD